MRSGLVTGLDALHLHSLPTTSGVTCQEFHLCYLFPLEGKVCYVEYSEARNRGEHPAQIKLTDQRRGAVTRGSAPALQHGGRVPGI